MTLLPRFDCVSRVSDVSGVSRVSYGAAAFAALVMASCSNPSGTPPPPDPDFGLDVVIHDNATILWYRDAAQEDFISPARWDAQCQDVSDICVTVSSDVDYTCTVLPDTLYGTMISTLAPVETLVCYADTCRSNAGTYDIQNYRRRLIDDCDEDVALGKRNDIF